MSYTHITTPDQLAKFCDGLAQAKAIAFDTEFVSEHSYRSQLCLVQVCTPEELAVIDPLACGDLTRFWEALAAEGHETIVHAGREELGFSLTSINRCPANLVDVQIAAGLVGDEYPAGYSSLLNRELRVTMHKGETRTDWRRRPLSSQQLEYALDDVRYLIPLRDKLFERLMKQGRVAWLEAEMQAFQAEVIASRSRERWRRVSGISGMSIRSLAVAREVWRWREAEAQRRDVPARQVLRDDLLVELARKRTADVRQIRAVRGLDRGELQRFLPKIAEHIQTALDLPNDQLPHSERREVPNQITVLGTISIDGADEFMPIAQAGAGTGGHGQRRARFDRLSLGVRRWREADSGARFARRNRGHFDRRFAGGKTQHSHHRSPLGSSASI